MANKYAYTWYKRGTQVFEMLFGLQLPAGVTLTGTPTVEVEQGSDAAGWTDRTSEVTVSSVSIVDDAENGNTDGAVQWRLTTTENAEPEAATNYRFIVTVDRSDGVQEVGERRLRIKE